MITLRSFQHSAPDSAGGGWQSGGGGWWGGGNDHGDGDGCDNGGGSGDGSSPGSAGSGAEWARPGLVRVARHIVAITNRKNGGGDFMAKLTSLKR